MITDADYKQMYLIMFRASEEAISLLIQAQRECEELYLSASERGEPQSRPEET